MITIYFLEGSVPTIRSFRADEHLPKSPLWVDLRAPTEDEIRVIQTYLEIEIPSKGENWKNHVLGRLYIDGGAAMMNAALITKVESPYPATSSVNFILSSKTLLTIHEIDPTSFRNFVQRLQQPGERFDKPEDLLEGLLEEVIMRIAYNSDVVVASLDELSHRIFSSERKGEKQNQKKPALLNGVLERLGAVADLNSKINESLHSVHRLLIFFKEVVSKSPELDKKIDILDADVAALVMQTAFLSDKVTFQLDATLGMINLEQNLTIKIFSMVAVFFMPPTLVTGLYGMNFEHIPELKWIWGYPIALMLMSMCAVVPYVYFRRRGWL